MKFSTRAEYGLKAMVNLAESYPSQKALKDIAREENISVKYLENLIARLKRSNLVGSQRGKNGGYILSGKPEQLSVGRIIEVLEGPIAPMKCASKACTQKGKCASRVVWKKLEEQIRKTLYSMKLGDLI